ncbi:PLP-dependent aminotransferase family protein [Labilithrix luteola]|nr:PLP-dependent aminotransferase family protein [Labilithrix luteola]
MIRALGAADPLSGRSPKTRRLATSLRRAIATGRARPGELLPSTRELARDHEVHRQTVMAALQTLAAEGWIEAEPRRGYRVSAVSPDAYLRAKGEVAERPPTGFVWRAARHAGMDVLPEARVSLANAGPDARLFPVDELRACYALALRDRTRRSLEAVDVEGHPRLVRALATYLRRVRGIAGRAVTITLGAQDALHSLAELLVSPGDRVAVECPGYPPAWEAFRLAGAELVPVPVDQHGLSVDALERITRDKPLRALYTTPLHQFPTTVTLTRERREALLRITARARIMVIEDDYDHEYHYAAAPAAPLAAYPGAGHVVYVGTLAKALFPSARVGFVAAEESLVARLSRLRRASLRACDGLAQLALAHWIDDGALERHLRRTRKVYARRRDAMVEALREFVVARGLGSFATPTGGLAIWLGLLGSDASAVAREALRRGVLVIPEASLQLRAGEDSHLRLGFASLTEAEARASLRVMRDALVTVSTSASKRRPR